MIPRDKRQAPQRDLLETYLEDILNPRHELVPMGKRIDWTACKQHFGQLYAVEAGRPGLPIRLHVGLQLLKHMYETTMMRFRHRIGEDGACELLKMSIALGQDTGVIAPESLKVAVIDTTVMPKAVAYPSDARLAGRTLIHVYAERDPGDGFEDIAGDLEDVYFATITGRYLPSDRNM